MLLALSATAIVVVALLWEVAMPRIVEAVGRHRARRAPPVRGGRRPPPPPPRPRAGPDPRLRPRPRAPRRAARPRPAAFVRQRRGVGDVPRPRVHPGVGRPGRRARPRLRRRTVRLPRLPAQADRR